MDSSEFVYSFHEMFICEKDVYLFFKPHYGDLHSYMKEKKRLIATKTMKILRSFSFFKCLIWLFRLKESEAKHLFYQIVKVVEQCHENGIIVRDIKLKKFVFADSEK